MVFMHACKCQCPISTAMDFTLVLTTFRLNLKESMYTLFIDTSNLSLKMVLLHNGNQHPSTPVEHTVHMKQTKT
jgi:NADPH-dependent 7-cyano-7-deazaguanine reductase QueF